MAYPAMGLWGLEIILELNNEAFPHETLTLMFLSFTNHQKNISFEK